MLLDDISVFFEQKPTQEKDRKHHSQNLQKTSYKKRALESTVGTTTNVQTV